MASPPQRSPTGPNSDASGMVWSGSRVSQSPSASTCPTGMNRRFMSVPVKRVSLLMVWFMLLSVSMGISPLRNVVGRMIDYSFAFDAEAGPVVLPITSEVGTMVGVCWLTGRLTPA